MSARAVNRNEHIGYRYLRWGWYVEPSLTALQKAQVLERFAAEFESLPPNLEPYDGWGNTMAYLCDRIARRHRGEHVGPWLPEWERRRASDHEQRVRLAS